MMALTSSRTGFLDPLFLLALLITVRTCLTASISEQIELLHLGERQL